MGHNYADDWQHYWDTATPTSIAGGFENGYDGEIYAYWGSVLQGVTGHVIDLACGNGALTWVADDILNASSQNAKITGIDYADISPFETLKKSPDDFPAINFIGNTSIEELPYGDASVDAVISQWGLEYSDLDKTLPEIIRVLRPGGRLGLICHHESSGILGHSRKLYARYQVIFDKPEIFDKLEALDRLYNSKTNIQQVYKDPAYVSLIADINALMAYYNEEFAKNPDMTIGEMNNYLQALMKLFANTAYVQNPNRKAALDKNKQMIYLSGIRMENLFESALSTEGFQLMVDTLSASGFTVKDTGPIIQGEMGDIGHRLTAEKIA